MKKKLFHILLLLFVATSFFAQTFLLNGEIGKFKSASAFSVTPSGYFYIADKELNEIIKLDTLNNIVKSVGGYGWDNSAFDEPVDIFATDLRVYVTDKNNNRIQVFDKDLNFLFLIQTEDIANNVDGFEYPVSCATSTLGDIFILDSDNTRVLKFNSTGDFLLEFGNYSSGDFFLEEPTKLALSQDSKIFLLDNNSVSIFDQYGMGLLKIRTKFEPTNLNITFNNLIVNSTDSLYYQNLAKPVEQFVNITPQNFSLDENIIEATIFNRSLYILTESRILIFKIK